MSNRSELLAVVKTRLEAIRVTNGYATEAGATIFIGEAPDLGPDDPTSALAMLIGDDEPHWAGEKLAIRLPIRIAALVVADLDGAWATIEAMLEDIKRAVELPDRRLGRGLVSPLVRGATRTLPREPGTRTIGVSVTYVLDYQEAWGNP